MEIANILNLHKECKLQSGDIFRFNFYKDDKKFLIKVTYLNENDILIGSAYEDNIDSMYSSIKDLESDILNIDDRFKDKFKEKIKIQGPVIYGEGHGTGHDLLHCDCCRNEESNNTEFLVVDINKSATFDNRLDHQKYCLIRESLLKELSLI
jgi:hypothetical protein